MLIRLLILAALGFALASCDLTDPSDIVPVDVLTVEIMEESALANGVARVPVVVTLIGDTPTGAEVTVSTDAGSFSGADRATPQTIRRKIPGRTLDFTLISPVRSGVATVTATTSGFSVLDEITFLHAPAEWLELTTSQTSASANGVATIDLTAHLFRSSGEGVPSAGTRVGFTFYLNGAEAAELTSTVETDTAGVANRTISTRTPGLYLAVARSGEFADSVTLLFQDPQSGISAGR